VSRAARLSAVLLLAALGAVCGGDSPSGPGPAPSSEPGNPVAVVVFYDEDGNRQSDGDERARVPGVSVDVAGHRGETAVLTGRAVVSGVPAGQHSAAIDAATLPPFYRAGPARPVSVPSSSEVELAATLSIGNNRANFYMAFGDSITAGDGSSDGNGYPTWLEQRLRGHFGRGTVINRGATATRSTEGVGRIQRNLGLTHPAYTLILYGTNDWVECRGAVPCITIDSLRSIVRTVRDFDSLPVLATIIPANPERTPPERNEWVSSMNELVRQLAADEGAALADLEAAFLQQPDLAALFSDHVHPNDQGYQVMAAAFFQAIAGTDGT
jgi:lysophospholipase L1-like esterase